MAKNDQKTMGEKEIDWSDRRSLARKGGRIPGVWRRMPSHRIR